MKIRDSNSRCAIAGLEALRAEHDHTLCPSWAFLEIADRKMRKTQFELKAAQPPDPVYWVITSGMAPATVKLIPQHEQELRGRIQ